MLDGGEFRVDVAGEFGTFEGVLIEHCHGNRVLCGITLADYR